jgi:lysophospholipase L1-like esterase
MTARRALLAAVLIVCAAGPLAAATASAPAALQSATQAPPVTLGSRYLALGDSVTFGYQEPQVVPAPEYRNASSFPGYPEQLGAELHLIVANAACPGETSASLIDSFAQSNGCENSLPPNSKVGYRRQFPLHVRYKGGQMAYALAYLRAHKEVSLVSLMIGANDLFICQKTTPDGCTSSSEERATFAKVAHNIRRILSAIRNKAHYRGQLAIVNYYSLNYASPFIDGVITAGNKAEDAAATPFHVDIADGYGELKAAALHSGGDACAAGLLTQLPSLGKCGVHPSYAGQALLAQALEKAIRR